ncbi:MAG TPA: hypothetical protein VIN73_11440 [Vicingaceae bacterium]
MKKIVTFLAVIFITISGFAQVEFKGYIVNEKGKKLNNVEIKLYEDNSLIHSDFFTNKFAFNLWVNRYYTIELSKEGYFTKRIVFSTLASVYYADPFECDIELIKKSDDIDDSDFDFPVAIVEYKQYQGGFHYNIVKNNGIEKEGQLITQQEE